MDSISPRIHSGNKGISALNGHCTAQPLSSRGLREPRAAAAPSCTWAAADRRMLMLNCSPDGKEPHVLPLPIPNHQKISMIPFRRVKVLLKTIIALAHWRRHWFHSPLYSKFSLMHLFDIFWFCTKSMSLLEDNPAISKLKLLLFLVSDLKLLKQTSLNILPYYWMFWDAFQAEKKWSNLQRRLLMMSS